MDTYEGLIKSIKTKIKLLHLADEETQKTIKKPHIPSLERQQRVLEAKMEEVQELKLRRGENRQNTFVEHSHSQPIYKI